MNSQEPNPQELPPEQFLDRHLLEIVRSRSRIQEAIKRGIDLLGSGLGLLTLSVPFLIIAAVIRLTSRGPAFYPWRVVGKNCKPFIGYKFRTMVVNADELKGQLLERNEMVGPVFKMADDPRRTVVGKFLRKFSVDELPQLWSVFKGDMSLVGPRPCLQSEFAHFSEFHRQKFAVTPGITCLWQIRGRNDIHDLDTWVKLDLEYIENWSIWLDLKILVKTIPVVLTGRGAA